MPTATVADRMRHRSPLNWFTGLAFWSAILLAFGYPAFLLAIDQGYVPRTVFFGFVLAHVLTLSIGYHYPVDSGKSPSA